MSINVVFVSPPFLLQSIGQESDVSADSTGSVVLGAPKGVLSIGEIDSTSLRTPSAMLSVTGVTDGLSTVLSAPTATLLVSGTTGTIVTVALQTTATLTIAGLAGDLGNVTLSTPVAALTCGEANSAQLTTPAESIGITGTTGVLGSVALFAPDSTLALSASIPFIASATLDTPSQRVVLTGTTGTNSALRLELTRVALAISGATGSVGSVDLELPATVLSASGGAAVSGSVALTIPLLRLQVTGQRAANADSTIGTLVMHTESMALTTYTNYPFNSFAVFNGVTLGASDNGIFALSGATDNGALIAAAARVGISDFGTSHLKRVDRLYVGYRTDGNLVLRVLTDEINVRDYLLTATGKSGLHGNHIRIGKGLEARYWQFEVQNQNGADFELNSVECKPTVLKRRVGGGSW